jgi:hypothetical protein
MVVFCDALSTDLGRDQCANIASNLKSVEIDGAGHRQLRRQSREARAKGRHLPFGGQ